MNNIQIAGYTKICWANPQYTAKQEAKREENKKKGLPINEGIGRASGGMMIWVRNDVHNEYKFETKINTNHLQCITMKHKQNKTMDTIKLINTYIRPYDNKTNKQEIDNQIDNTLNTLKQELITNTQNNTIITGDLNCRHKTLGDTKTEPHGKKLIDFMNTNNIKCLNQIYCPNKPTFTGTYESSKSLVDLALIPAKEKTKWQSMRITDIGKQSKQTANRHNTLYNIKYTHNK